MISSDPLIQRRSPTGQVTGLDACPAQGSEQMPESKIAAPFSGVLFTPKAETNRKRRSAEDPHRKPAGASMTLLELASCASAGSAIEPDGSMRLQTHVKSADLIDFAKKHGPLIAREPASCVNLCAQGRLQSIEESTSLWASAALTANIATLAAELASGALPMRNAQKILVGLSHWRLQANEGKSFELYLISRPTSASYAHWLGTPRFIRREVIGERIGYAFLLGNETGYPPSTLEIALALFAEEPAASDFSVLMRAFDLSIETGAQLAEEASAATGKRNAVPTQPERPGDHTLTETELSFNEEDRPILGLLCRTLAVAHMNDIQVDVFSTDESTGPFVFGSYLSWLWYDFSLGIGQARIHYCARCGKGFSTAGHRGIEKRYCSDRCREAAHNERTAQSKAWARRLFLQKEMSIDAIRKRLFAHEQKTTGSERIKKWLSSWPDLKHALDEDIQSKGWGSPLLARCRKEGLDLDKLLSAKRKKELAELKKEKEGPHK